MEAGDDDDKFKFLLGAGAELLLLLNGSLFLSSFAGKKRFARRKRRTWRRLIGEAFLGSVIVTVAVLLGRRLEGRIARAFPLMRAALLGAPA